MSYPDPVHLGDGAVLARFRPASTPADLTLPHGTASYLATGRTTGGQFGLYRWDMAPEAPGAAPHFHRTISESFLVLSGAIQIFDGTAWLPASVGDFAHVPEGGVHGFRNPTGEAASMLILFVPGAPRETYFEGLADLATGRWSPTREELQSFLVEHDNIQVDPGPA